MTTTSWVLVVMLVGSVHVSHFDTRLACETVKTAIVEAYAGRASGLVDAKCIPITGDEPRSKK